MSLLVCYNHRTLRIAIEPGANLNEARDAAVAAAGVGDPGLWTLARNNRPLNLAVPFRLSGLVSNAHVDLVPIGSYSMPTEVRIKLRIFGSPDFVGKFRPSTTAADIAAAAGHAGSNILLGDRPLSPQTSLAAAGITSATVLTLQCRAGGPQVVAEGTTAGYIPAATGVSSDTSSIKPEINAIQTSNPIQMPVKTVPGENIPDSLISGRPFSVQGPTSASINSTYSLSDDVPEMSRDQFLKYHNYLRHQANPAMISRETREQIERDRRRFQISHTVVRVRLPDGSHIEASFSAGETGEAVYDFVRTHLRRPERSFTLISMGPTDTLRKDQNLIDDFKSGGRMLLVLQWMEPGDHSSPVLDATTLEYGAAQKQATISSKESTKADTSKNSELAAAEHAGQGCPSAKNKKIPNWLKLHKKF